MAARAMIFIFKSDFKKLINISLLLFFVYITNVQSVPDDYCLGVLDRSDCGLPPTAVFSYSKPGSRCEIETWRGCPSENLFKNEYQCSDLCIGKLFRSIAAEETVTQQIEESKEKIVEEIVHVKEICSGLIDNNCSSEDLYTIYTFDNKSRSCIEAKTCFGSNATNSTNTFGDKTQCEETCMDSHDKWANSVQDLKADELQELNEVMDNAVPPQKLKQVIKHSPTTEETTSSTTTTEAEEKEEEEEKDAAADGLVEETETI